MNVTIIHMPGKNAPTLIKSVSQLESVLQGWVQEIFTNMQRMYAIVHDVEGRTDDMVKFHKCQKHIAYDDDQLGNGITVDEVAAAIANLLNENHPFTVEKINADMLNTLELLHQPQWRAEFIENVIEVDEVICGPYSEVENGIESVVSVDMSALFFQYIRIEFFRDLVRYLETHKLVQTKPDNPRHTRLVVHLAHEYGIEFDEIESRSFTYDIHHLFSLYNQHVSNITISSKHVEITLYSKD